MTMVETSRILDLWHSVEFLNAYNLDEALDTARRYRNVVKVARSELFDGCWNAFASQRRTVYLMPFALSRAEQVIDRFVDASKPDPVELVRDREMSPDQTCFARMELSAEGVPNFDTISFSALPWALGRLEHGDVEGMNADAFEASVSSLKRDLNDALSRHERVFGPELLLEVVQLFARWAQWGDDLVEDLAYLEVHEGRSKAVSAESDTDSDNSPDEPEKKPDDTLAELAILNSFYVHDLMLAKRALISSRKPRALAAYLAQSDAPKLDLDKPEGQQAVLENLRPSHSIVGRWPSSPEHIQSLMQQFALNRMRTMQEGEILAVNGPPGTGKTTLLRDLIASLIVQRADALAGLASAQAGLSGEMVTAVFSSGKSYAVPLLAPALTGFEIVVASTNNGAVENLSLELPQLKGIDAARADTLSYFRPVATKYAGARLNKSWSQPAEPVWGLVAAALGKKSNRDRFAEVFSFFSRRPQDKRGERILGKKDVDTAAWQQAGAVTYWRYVEQTKPMRAGFAAAQHAFRRARERHDAQLAKLKVFDAVISRLQQAWPRVCELWPAAPALAIHHATVLLDGVGRLLRRLDDEAMQAARSLGPRWLHWLMRWFKQDAYARWEQARSNLATIRLVESDLFDAQRLVAEHDVHLWDGGPLDSHANQERAFWQGAPHNKLRSDLFEEAMRLHEAFFVEIAQSQQGREMVFALSSLLSRPPLEPARQALWQWFFMLTPVVSSTFASIRRQFAGLGSEALGWLIVDEAGQATPQAAVGAIMRARRVVVVGDPLQIEPVVTQPTRLLDKLGQHWLGELRHRYAVDSHSVQTFADRAYPMGVRHPIDASRFIGIPLVMHRRCDNPMFSIANEIAYAGRMKLAKSPEVAAHPVLGPSAWWNVDGVSQDGSKYIQAQARLLLARLADLYEHAGGPGMPDVFVITPFREVKRGLLEWLGSEDRWQQALAGRSCTPPNNLVEWAAKSIGTVHTFQGKEADVVFFVLGCDESHAGAMGWAAAKPNLLNVAATRARRFFYVLGDRNHWGNRPFFSTAVDHLSQALPGR